MNALLLAAGYGTRLRPLTDTIPKCLVPIHGKPLLAYWLDLLLSGGIERAVINTHYLADRVAAFVAKSPWRNRIELAYEAQLLGTGGTVLANRKFFGDRAFMVVHADNLSQFDVRSFIECHARRPRQAVLTMMTFDTDAPETCGIVVIDKEGIVREMHEKARNPPSRRANAAVYIFEPEVIDFMTGLDKPVVDISTEVIPHYLGRIHTFHNAGYHRDIGNPESLRRAEQEFVSPPLR